jgi:cellulose synthase/poly-beta-1,6-N-acetylglucosamine synthase-like glycosyltransferase
MPSSFFSIVGLLLALATMPLVVELAVLTLAALLPALSARKKSTATELPSLSILVPAHNEEALIGRCIRSLLASANSRVELLVVAHNCTDATAFEAEAAGARVLVLNDPNQTGKGCALNHGFAAALAGGSQAVLVIDADSVVSYNLVSEVRRKLAEGAQALQCRYEVYNAQETQGTKLTALAFQAFNVVRPRGRARLGLSAGIFGNGFALHRDVLQRIPYGAHSVVEDLEYHLSLVRAGVRVEFLDTTTVRGEMPVSTKGASTQRARWEGGRLRIMKRWAPKLMLEVLRGRVRLTEPFFDLLALPLAIEVSLLLITALLPGIFFKWYVLMAFGVIATHLFAAARSGPDFWGSIKVLLTAPAYVLWKLRMLPTIWRTSHTEAAWVRTERNTSPNLQ